MTDSTTKPDTSEVRLPEDVPTRWANSLMKWALTTPGLQGMIGQGVALLTFTGRRSGTQYKIPVSYDRDGDTVTVITKRVRNWWHNFESPAEVRVRLAGREYAGTATIRDDENVLAYMTEFLARRPIDAKAYGLDKDDLAAEKIERIMPHIVLIDIALTPEAQATTSRDGEAQPL